jgi:MFS family permease
MDDRIDYVLRAGTAAIVLPALAHRPGHNASVQARMLLLAVMLVSVSTLPVWLLGAGFFQIGPEFGLTAIHFGWLTAAFFLTASISSLLMGRRIAGIGWQRAMRINIVASALLLLGFATVVRSVSMLVLLLVLAAAVYGLSNPTANLALALHTAPRRVATVFGIKHAGIPSSTLLAGLAVPAIVVDHGWRPAFLAGAGLAATVWWLIPPDAPTARHAPAPARSSLGLGRGDLYSLAAVSALATWAATALGTFMVAGAMSVGFGERQAGWIQFGGSALSILARLVYGLLADRFRWGGFVTIGLLAGSGGVVFMLLPEVLGAGFVLAAFVAYVTGWAWPGLLTSTVVDANREAAAGSSAITQAGVFVGAALGPVVLGALIDRSGFGAAWRITGTALLLSATMVVLLGTRVAGRRP